MIKTRGTIFGLLGKRNVKERPRERKNPSSAHRGETSSILLPLQLQRGKERRRQRTRPVRKELRENSIGRDGKTGSSKREKKTQTGN